MGKGIETAIGCVPTENIQGFFQFMLKWVMGAAGGVLVFMIIITGYNVITSEGDPNKLKEVKENIVSIISGLLFVFFSMVILRYIGVELLGFPGF